MDNGKNGEKIYKWLKPPMTQTEMAKIGTYLIFCEFKKYTRLGADYPFEQIDLSNSKFLILTSGLNLVELINEHEDESSYLHMHSVCFF